MPLPVIKHPVFKITVPSTNKTVSYRPYTVQEEKLLLIMKMSNDVDEIIGTIKQIISNCVFEDIDVDKLAMFDIEYLFLNIRKVSVSNVVELNYTEEVEGKPVRVPFTVDLENVKVKFNPDHSSTIKINDDMVIKMNYPNVGHILKLEDMIQKEEFSSTKIDEYIYDMFLDCVDAVYDAEKMYGKSEFTKEELDKFISSLPADIMVQIRKFFDTLPSLEHEVEVVMPNGIKRTVAMKGLKDFFIF